MKLIKIDENGMFVEDKIFDKIPTITEIQMVEGEEIEVEVINPQYIKETPKGFYHPRWDGERWVEGKTQTEIDAIKNEPVEKTELEKMNEIINMLLLDSLGV